MSKFKPTKTTKELLIYQASSRALELKQDLTNETVWATQAQIAEIFEVNRTVATKHINNILKDNEVDGKSNVQKMHIANSDKPVTYYSLDIILAVGYRTNSARAITFRKWATKTLKEHLTKGYTLNKRLLLNNQSRFITALNNIKAILPIQSELESKQLFNLNYIFHTKCFFQII